jgi:hypothetical protein
MYYMRQTALVKDLRDADYSFFIAAQLPFTTIGSVVALPRPSSPAINYPNP